MGKEQRLPGSADNVSPYMAARASLVAVYYVLRETARRTHSAGWRSGWAFFHTHAANFYLRVRGRLDKTLHVSCPCCGWEGFRFRTIDCGTFTVPNAECPQCRCHERHRMLHLFLERRPPAFMKHGGTVLHFAPERHLFPWMDRVEGLRAIGTDYDVNTVRVCGRPPRFASDMMFLAMRDAAFDGIFCIHVLEHVPDDRKGLQELWRVMKPSAEAVIMVPLMMGWTESREFGAPDPNQYGHVRGYSPLDVEQRLTMFDYEKVMPGDFLDDAEAVRYSIPDSQVIYLCKRTR